MISKELDPGERLLWAGVPRQGFLLRGTDALAIPFSLAWCGFAVFWEYEVLSVRGPLVLKLWGIPFVLLGLYLVFGRFIVDALQRGAAAYGLTDRRLVISGGAFMGRSVTSSDLRTLTNLTMREHGNGYGSIAYGPLLPYYNYGRFGRGSAPWFTGGPCVLDHLEDARAVFAQIRAAHEHALAAR